MADVVAADRLPRGASTGSARGCGRSATSTAASSLDVPDGAAPRPRHAGAGAVPARVRQRAPLARRPQPLHPRRRRRAGDGRPGPRHGAQRRIGLPPPGPSTGTADGAATMTVRHLPRRRRPAADARGRGASGCCGSSSPAAAGTTASHRATRRRSARTAGGDGRDGRSVGATTDPSAAPAPRLPAHRGRRRRRPRRRRRRRPRVGELAVEGVLRRAVAHPPGHRPRRPRPRPRPPRTGSTTG